VRKRDHAPQAQKLETTIRIKKKAITVFLVIGALFNNSNIDLIFEEFDWVLFGSQFKQKIR
jgi:hypothetical protein